MFWVSLLIWAVATVAFELIRPKPTFEDARPASLGDFSFPTATEGRPVPLVWGRIRTKGPNLIWYGNFRKVARIENVKTGMFSSEDVIVGYRYYLGMQFAVCHGPVDALIGIRINEKPVGGSVTGTGYTIVNNVNLFGGEEHGSGGMSGIVDWYEGDDTQTVNTYLDAKISGQVPAYRGVAHAVWHSASGNSGGWIGNSSNVASWEFEVERIPDGLNLESAIGAGGSTPTTGTCNPMNVLYEILTNTDWGLSVPSGDINTSNFQDVAAVLHDEGNGFAMILDRTTEVTKVIDEIQRQVDGSLYFNRSIGQWEVKLARDDYTVGTLDVFDESSILRVEEFTRQTWEETTNQVRVQFVDSSDEYKTSYGFAQDPANMDLQGQTVSADVSYPGCKDKVLANDLAARDLRALSYPLAKVKFTVDRSAWNLTPGSVFKFSWDRLGISELVFRVAKINYGTLEDSKISIFAIQDIFAASSGIYSDPTGSGWDEPTDDPAFATGGDTLIFEAPRQIVAQDPYSSSQHPRLFYAAQFPGDGTTNFKAYNEFATSPSFSGTYSQDTTIAGFVLCGVLDGALNEYGSSAARPDTTYSITVDEDDVLDSIAIDGSSQLVDDLATICMIDDEFIGFEKAESIGGGQWRLSRIHRGLFNSAPTAHADNSRVWFISTAANLSRNLIWYDGGYDETRSQLRGVNGAGEETTEVATPEIDVSLVNRYQMPPAPRDPYLNTVYADKTNVSVDASYTSETGRTGDDARGLKVEITPRDWRVDVPTEDTSLSATWSSDSYKYDFYLYLDPTGDNVAVGPFTYSGGSSPEIVFERNEIIKALGDNAVIPTDANLRVITKHTPASSEITSDYPMPLDGIEIYSALQGNDDLTFGAVTSAESAAVVFGENGDYTFDIHTALPSSGTLEANVNGGGFSTLISAGNTTGVLAITAGDSVTLRWATSGPADIQFFDITGPTAEMGYGVLE